MSPGEDAIEPRQGDSLDRRALETWLLGHVRGARGPLHVRQFPHGFSNLNYLLDLGAQQLVLRRPPPGAGAPRTHDMGREYRLLASLYPAWGKVAEPLAYCPDPDIIGAPFLVTRRVRGTILRRQLGVPDWNAERLAELGENFASTLAELHRIDAALSGIGAIGQPRSWAERQIEAWSRRYLTARTADSPDLMPLVRWLRIHVPREARAALIHSDYRYENLVLDPSAPARVVAVLDWEMATLADPQLDLGLALGYWVEACDPVDLQRFGVTHLPGNPDRETIVRSYSRHAGRALSDPVFLYAFGLLRLASVLQPIYARLRRGEHGDTRHARVIGLVHDLADQAERAIRLDRISALH